MRDNAIKCNGNNAYLKLSCSYLYLNIQITNQISLEIKVNSGSCIVMT